MDLKTPLHPSSSRIDAPPPRDASSSMSRFIVTATFAVGNALTLVPTSILRRDSSTFRALVLSIILAFSSAFVSLLMIHHGKAGLPARICRWSSLVAMAAVLVLLLSVSSLHR
ncbi:hypothetical protein ACJRO7_029474 [Eucalyptus globulus]|uniref:Uncharacterized protein n=1 Tax=Eucalyptus globulus TaxID=34317 RepID=A0ABD3JAE3_EUCGL